MNNDFIGKKLPLIGGRSGMGLEIARLIPERNGKTRTDILSTGEEMKV